MSKLDRMRALEVVRPDEHSTTLFVPFVQVDERDWRDLLAVVDAAEKLYDALMDAVAEIDPPTWDGEREIPTSRFWPQHGNLGSALFPLRDHDNSDGF